MVRDTADSQGNSTELELTATSSVRGVAKDQLIFIIVCAVALAVAGVALVRFLGGDSRKVTASNWQCVDCNHEFRMKKIVRPPIECSKCGGQAVRLSHRTCPKCKAQVLVWRIRVPGNRAGGGPGAAPAMGMMGLPPMEVQYWLKQSDGNYAWSDWMPAGSPQARQIDANLKCTECGVNMSAPPAAPARRSRRGR